MENRNVVKLTALPDELCLQADLNPNECDRVPGRKKIKLFKIKLNPAVEIIKLKNLIAVSMQVRFLYSLMHRLQKLLS